MGNATSTTTTVPVSPALVKAAEAAWAAYASACRFGGATQERTFAYNNARVAEHRLWIAQGSPAAGA